MNAITALRSAPTAPALSTLPGWSVQADSALLAIASFRLAVPSARRVALVASNNQDGTFTVRIK